MSATIIDRYLVRQFVQLFLMAYVSLAGLYTVIDAFTNLDSFLDAAHKQGGGLLGLMLKFYAFRWLSFFDLTSGVLALLAAMFTLTLFRSRNEMTALLAAGIAKRRIALPVIAAAAIATLLAAAGRELVFPRFATQLSQNPKDLLGEAAQAVSPRYDNKTDILLHGSQTVARNQRIVRPNFQLPEILDRYGRYLVAEDAFYEPPSPGRPGGYRFSKVQQPAGLTEKPSVIGKGAVPIILCPSDTPWLKADECFVVSDVDFHQLAGQTSWRHMSTLQLLRTMRNESVDYGADLRVALHARLVKPFLDMNLLLLGLPLILGRENRNVFLAVALCVGVVAVFLLSVYCSQYLGSAVYTSPHFAAWLPLMIFVPIAAAMCEPLFE
jgi:lipopolysaccharide export system permease protein